LVRYSIGDYGGAMSFREMAEKFKNHGLSLKKEIERHGLKRYSSELPFVFVYERSDFATTLYGLQIYPEHIREALIQSPVNKMLTGKFTIATRFDKKQNQYLEMNLEMLPNAKMNESARKAVLKAIVLSMEKLNSEFRELHCFLGTRALPRLVFWPAESPKYFRPGIKQQWVKK
jgi:phenylacetate-CoA ligase